MTIFLHKKNDSNKPLESDTSKELKLVVERGAFHYDRFELTPTMITYFPEENAQHAEIKYNTISKVVLDTTETKQFFKQIEDRGFWNLQNRYTASSSCLSGLKITLYTNGKSKSIICDDFERECPDLIKYIDKKVVELEGNNLKRIYLPG